MCISIQAKTCVMLVHYRVSKDNRMSFRHAFEMQFLDCMFAMRYVMRRYEVAYREQVPWERGGPDRTWLDSIDEYITRYDEVVTYRARDPRFPLWPRGAERKDEDWRRATRLLEEFVDEVASGVQDAKLPVIEGLQDPEVLARFVREHLTTFLREFYLQGDAERVTPTGWAEGPEGPPPPPPRRE